MQFEHVLFIVQNPIKIHVHNLFYLELQTIFLPITKYDNAFTNSEDEIFYIVYHTVLCYIFCNSFVLPKNWEKLQLKKYIMVLFVLMLSFQILPTFMINIIIFSTFLWYVLSCVVWQIYIFFYNFNICRNPI